ncbi:YtxH domain-containing protein [Albibacterium bauzanense]|uniref:YtxH-like protein n=1 Tax=Albibacterium bauzanense TaxID=653929 RepID=A0A4R1LV23_9SPHI|nr:YtxH domain-containing protein [Albibacterium bauzanense]TCK82935.1 YtxH-like protein [Albibacterium bauzanense]
MNDNTKIVAALLAGLAAGAALGLLFAPEKGTDTREKINESLKDLGEAIKERSAEQKEQFNELKEKVVSSIKTKMNRGKAEFEDALDEHA